MDTVEIPVIGAEYRRMSDRAYDALLMMIAQRKVLPGDRLLLDDLAERLQVSHTPIQVALSRLEAERLVQRVGRRGYCVTLPTAEELRDLFDMRLMYERHAAEYGIGNVTAEHIAKMAEVAEDCVRLKSSADPNEVFQGVLRDREFHRLVVGLNHNQMVLDLYDRLSFHIHVSRLGMSQGSGLHEGLIITHAQHCAIVVALGNRDSSEAKRAIHDHIMRSLSIRLTQLQTAGA